MTNIPDSKKRFLLQGLIAATVSSAIIYAVLWKTHFISPLGTIVVPAITLTVTATAVFLRSRM